MKKISLFTACAVSLALILASCGQNETPQEPTQVQEIAVSAVVPASVSENAVALPEGDEGKTVFEEKIISSVAQDITNSIGALISAGAGSATISSPATDPSCRSVTPDSLAEDFKRFPECFTFTNSGDGLSGSGSGSWEASTGDIDLKGILPEELSSKLSVRIDALKANLNYGYTITPTSEEQFASAKTSGYANASARAAFSYNLTDFSDTLKNAKFNYLAYANATGLNAVLSNVTNPSPEEIVKAIESLSGAIAAYYGINGALYFEVPVTDVTADSGKLYNGVFAVNTSIGLASTLSKEVAESYVALYDEISKYIPAGVAVPDGTASVPTPNVPAILKAIDDSGLITVNVDVSIYDTNGTKLFSYIKADSFTDVFTQGTAIAEIIGGMVAGAMPGSNIQ